MPLTIGGSAQVNLGPTVKMIKCTLTFDSSYAQGGEEADFSGETPQIIGVQVSPGQDHRWFEVLDDDFDSGKFKLKAYSSGTTEVASAADLSGVVIPALITCKTQLGPNL